MEQEDIIFETNQEDEEYDGYQALGNAIVIQASEDYREYTSDLIRHIKSSKLLDTAENHREWENKYMRIWAKRNDCIKFFSTDLCKLITNYADLIQKRLKQEALIECRKNGVKIFKVDLFRREIKYDKYEN